VTIRRSAFRPVAFRGRYRAICSGQIVFVKIISEVRKGERCDSHVAAWFASIADADIYLSVLVVGEIRKGIERARRSDPAQARALDKWLSTVKQSCGERILPIDQMVADEWVA
jgi:toxin FitB